MGRLLSSPNQISMMFHSNSQGDRPSPGLVTSLNYQVQELGKAAKGLFLVAMHELKVDRLVNWLAGILRRRNMGVDDYHVSHESSLGNHRIIMEFVNGEPRFCVETVLDGGGIVRTRWCKSGEEARSEARSGYVHYVEDYPEVN